MMPRKRRTKAAIEQFEAQVLAVLQPDHPQSVRHVYYRLTDPRLPEPVEKTERGYRQVQARIAAMREAGKLPYEWITDMTRLGWHVPTYTDAGDFLDRVTGLYRADLWAGSNVRVEVWVESRSIAAVLQADCERLAVSLYPCGGFASKTLAYEAAQALNYRRRPAVILYVGDYDPAGVLIDQALERELLKHLSVDLEFIRLAINAGQIQEHDLPTKPRKATDRRRTDIAATVEAEAMPAAVLRELVANAVESYLPAGAVEQFKVVEEAEREGMERLAEYLSDNGLTETLEALDEV